MKSKTSKIDRLAASERRSNAAKKGWETRKNGKEAGGTIVGSRSSFYRIEVRSNWTRKADRWTAEIKLDQCVAFGNGTTEIEAIRQALSRFASVYNGPNTKTTL